MFRFSQPTAIYIEQRLATAERLPCDVAPLLHRQDGFVPTQVPFFYAHDVSNSVIGHGAMAFAAACRAFERWSMFDLGWVHVANPEARIAVGQLVAVEAKSLGLWTLNISRIVEAIDTPHRFGFIYATTQLHVEDGEERFLLDFNQESETVTYNVEAVSRPRNSLARLGLPITRMFQHRFARDSHQQMREAVLRAS